MKQRHRASNRLLFIVRRREETCGGYSYSMTSGLRTSAGCIVRMLEDAGVVAELVEVCDNNDIDRVVSAFKPTVVVIEALWVVPAKFDELSRLHPTVTWIVRGHSEVSFLAAEGIAVEWLLAYATKSNVLIAMNTEAAQGDVLDMLRAAFPAVPDSVLCGKVLYLPNYYPIPFIRMSRKPTGPVAHVGCFGAVRPLKNQLLQAIAALRFSQEIKRPVHFHINANRVEGGGDPILKNLRALFAKTPYAMLVEHEWLPHDQFLTLMGTMDISMQVSLTETFNIVTADAIASGVPVVVSPEIDWLDDNFFVDPNDSGSITGGLFRAWRSDDCTLAHQSRLLLAHSSAAESQWLGKLL